MSEEKKNLSLIEHMEQAAILLQKYDLTHIEAEIDTIKFKVRRQVNPPTPPWASPVHHISDATSEGYVYNQPLKRESSRADMKSASLLDENDINVVKSPMVGTVYLAPAPGAKPFITVGQAVKSNQVLLIIEAMKTMNNILAPRDGIIKRILVENEEPIEFHSPLLILE